MALLRPFNKYPPDRLVEISDRVYVFDCCLSTNVLKEDEFKMYLEGIARQLQDHYPDASFMVFNFREGDNSSQISDIMSEYDVTVFDYPRRYQSCPVLPLEMIHHFSRSAECWLSLEGQGNVVLMHCDRGGWPVLAFMLSAFLLHRKQCDSERKALETVHERAPEELLRLPSPLNLQPSQLRYLQYVSGRSSRSAQPPPDTPLLLDCLILRDLPRLGGGNGCRPIIRVYGQDPGARANSSSMLIFSTPKNRAHLFRQEECNLVKLDVRCRVEGDVVLECVHLQDDLVEEEMVFRVMFHTSFVQPKSLMLSRDDVDTLWDAKEQFSKDFRTEVLFADAVTTSPPPWEDADFASPEDFYEVEEIFSDGAECMGDSDSSLVLSPPPPLPPPPLLHERSGKKEKQLP